MQTLTNKQLASTTGGDGDSFWEDFGEFFGGAIGGAQAGYGNVPGNPSTVLSGPILAGILAAMIN